MNFSMLDQASVYIAPKDNDPRFPEPGSKADFKCIPLWLGPANHRRVWPCFHVPVSDQLALVPECSSGSGG